MHNSRRITNVFTTTCLFLFICAESGMSQDLPSNDQVIKMIWEEGMTESSQVEDLAQVLLDSIGPRLSGSPNQLAAINWVTDMYNSWGITAGKEQYGTWKGWDRGHTHIDLVEPRKRTLNGTMLAWSPGTDGPVEGPVAMMPRFASQADFDKWLPTVEGKFIAISFLEPTCRSPESWGALATQQSLEKMGRLQQSIREKWSEGLRNIGGINQASRAIEEAGSLGVVTSRWSNGWGANKIFSTFTDEIPSIHLSCEDYGLIARLAKKQQGPILRLDAQSTNLGEVPVFNVVGEIKGRKIPEEFVLLSAHLDSWDGASGATDNGTGSVMMMEAMRILKKAYPNPQRTILVGHWGGEEQGLIGSAAFAEDHPEVVDGLQAAFNQDNGTWRIDYIRMQGFSGAGEHFGRWFSKIPSDISGHIDLDIPGVPERGGSDHMSFICRGAAGFRLQSHYPDYRQYTWHTDLDTFDKIVFDDLKNNATLAAMLAYLASEDPERISPTQRMLPQGEQWPECRPATRSFPG